MNNSNSGRRKKHGNRLVRSGRNSAIIRFLLFLSDWIYRKIGGSMTALVFTGYEKCEGYYKRSFFYGMFQGYEPGVIKNIAGAIKKKIIVSAEGSALVNGVKGGIDNLLALKIHTVGSFVISFGFYSAIMYLLKVFILNMRGTSSLDLAAGLSLMVFGGLLLFSKQSVFHALHGSRICNALFFRFLGFSERRSDKAFAERVEKAGNSAISNLLFCARAKPT